MNGFRPLRNDFVSASDQNTAKFTSKKIRCFGRKVHGKLRLRGRIRSSSQSIIGRAVGHLRQRVNVSSAGPRVNASEPGHALAPTLI